MITGMKQAGLALTATVLLLSACGQAADEDTTDESSSTTADERTTSSAGESSVTNTDETDSTLATTSPPEDDSTTSNSDGATSSTTTEGDSSTVSSQEPGEDPTIGTGTIDEGLWPFINDAVNQLTTSQSVAKTDVTVQSAKLVQWRDASAGCPEPDMQYAQVVTDGSVIELVVNDTTYWYHSGGSRGPFPCTSKLREEG